MKVFVCEPDRVKSMLDAFADGELISVDGYQWEIRAVDAVRTIGVGKVFQFTLSRVSMVELR